MRLIGEVGMDRMAPPGSRHTQPTRGAYGFTTPLPLSGHARRAWHCSVRIRA